jgi:hypothetical protein
MFRVYLKHGLTSKVSGLPELYYRQSQSFIYRKLRVPELWRLEQGRLQISLLQSDSVQGDRYVVSLESLNFPELALTEAIPQYVAQSKTAGRNFAIKAFRQWMRAQITSE